MAARNPYAPSAASLKVDRDSLGAGGDVWRDGKILVMNRDAHLPPRCIKCNEPAHEPTKRRTLYWHHPAVYLVILVQIIIYAIVAMAVRKSIVVEPGLCLEHKRKRRNLIIGAWLGIAASILLPIALVAVLPPDGSGWVLVLGLVMFLTFAIGGLVMGRVMTARKIDKESARIAGCGAPFLDSLPEYPG